MKLAHTRYPLIKVPMDVQLPLFLIKEELKSRKLFYMLEELGVSECTFEPHLDSLILQLLGMDKDDDRLCGKYFDIMERRSKKLDENTDSIAKQAFKAYHEILVIKQKADKNK